MSTWTAEVVTIDKGDLLVDVLHRNEAGEVLSVAAEITVPNTPGGKRDLARMVAALQMEEALTAIQWGTHDRCPACAGWECSPNGETDHAHTPECPVATALAAAKSLPETP